MVKTKNIIFILISYIFVSSLYGQANNTFKKYHAKYISTKIKIQTELFDVVFFQASQHQPRIRTFYLRSTNDSFRLILNEQSCDTTQFLNYKFAMKPKGQQFCESIVIDKSLLDLYALQFDKQKYWVLIGSIQGCTGKGCQYNLMVILNQKRPDRSNIIVGKYANITHFIVRYNKLCVLYQNISDEIILLEIETNKLTKLK